MKGAECEMKGAECEMKGFWLVFVNLVGEVGAFRVLYF